MWEDRSVGWTPKKASQEVATSITQAATLCHLQAGVQEERQGANAACWGVPGKAAEEQLQAGDQSYSPKGLQTACLGPYNPKGSLAFRLEGQSFYSPISVDHTSEFRKFCQQQILLCMFEPVLCHCASRSPTTHSTHAWSGLEIRVAVGHITDTASAEG